jgi:hypothetical protein
MVVVIDKLEGESEKMIRDLALAEGRTVEDVLNRSLGVYSPCEPRKVIYCESWGDNESLKRMKWL